ncbi:MAG: lycopene cyclase domain-containing protein [Calditrichaeota bacterium]|nr:MAG: lycopene cyclase domain-containing protein [Calditrichota bacterium]MBL1207817.1 lycopene cyclase domain-containing protein [Calditrichota bacterium]NOG47651.1 lycopene cyclase domain-containing protein [Calditrichota bacterium]
MSTYFWILLLTIIIPLPASFDKRIQFHKEWYAFIPAMLITGLFFIIWDIYFTQLQVWGFNSSHLAGIYLFNLPIEEIIFFVAIPYAIVFTYYSLTKVIPQKEINKPIFSITFLIALLLLIIALFNLDKIYTSITFMLTAIFLLMHIFILRSHYLKTFFISYAIIFLIPFIFVNGALTGMMTAEPVVWYNDSENLGIRIFTIPIEDFVYGMLLYLMNVTLFEQIKEVRKENRIYKSSALV